MKKQVGKSTFKGSAWGLLLAALVTGPAYADQLLGRFKVKVLFAETSDTAGVYLVEDLPQCLYGLMYIDITSSAGKARLALLTTAKSAGWSVTRLDYTKDANGKCVLYSVHVE